MNRKHIIHIISSTINSLSSDSLVSWHSPLHSVGRCVWREPGYFKPPEEHLRLSSLLAGDFTLPWRGLIRECFAAPGGRPGGCSIPPWDVLELCGLPGREKPCSGPHSNLCFTSELHKCPRLLPRTGSWKGLQVGLLSPPPPSVPQPHVISRPKALCSRAEGPKSEPFISQSVGTGCSHGCRQEGFLEEGQYKCSTRMSAPQGQGPYLFYPAPSTGPDVYS